MGRRTRRGVAEDDKGEIVGFVYGYFRDVPAQVLEKWRASKVGQVELMVVHPDHRGKGLGGGCSRNF